jgi:hypothetical protein
MIISDMGKHNRSDTVIVHGTPSAIQVCNSNSFSRQNPHGIQELSGIFCSYTLYGSAVNFKLLLL